MFELKKYRVVILMALKIDPKFEEKLACPVKNGIKNLANFQRPFYLSRQACIRDSLQYAFPFQKGPPSPFSLARNISVGTHLKKKLTNTNLFSKLPRYSLFPHTQSRQECEHFANGKH